MRQIEDRGSGHRDRRILDLHVDALDSHRDAFLQILDSRHRLVSILELLQQFAEPGVGGVGVAYLNRPLGYLEQRDRLWIGRHQRQLRDASRAVGAGPGSTSGPTWINSRTTTMSS